MEVKLERLNKAFVKNAIKEMREIARRAEKYADLLGETELDVEQEALIDNFSREFNHKFTEVEVKL